MTEIREIKPIQVETVRTYVINTPSISAPVVPVQLQLGFPVVEIPGCVEARRSAKENENLVSNDPDGNVVLCDAQYPSYDAMEFTPNEFIYTESDTTQRYEEPEIPATDVPPPQKIEDCPPPDAAKVGTKVEEGKREIVRYDLIGTKCITRYKEITMQQQIIDAVPKPPAVVGIASTAVISAVVAANTPLLLKIVKPITKQIIGKIKKLFGKKGKLLSTKERQIKQRELTTAVRLLKKMKK